MYSRRPKESHLDTIAYEIDMLEFCAAELRGSKPAEERVTFLRLEGFLLHYRNLVRFFAGESTWPDELGTDKAEVWAPRLLTDEDLRGMREPGKGLDKKWFKPISKYLQHCSTVRHEIDRSWDVEGMFEELRPVLSLFKTAFLNQSR